MTKANPALEMDIFKAIASNSYETVDNMISKFGNDVNEINDQGLSLLHICATYGHVETAKVLLGNGADVNQKDFESGWTPLHRSMYFKHIKMSLLLIKAGSKYDRLPNISNCEYSSPKLSTEKLKGNFIESKMYNNEDKEGLTPIELISLILSPNLKLPISDEDDTDCFTARCFNEIMCFGKSDFMLGVPLPNSSSDVTKPRRIDSLVYAKESMKQVIASKFHSVAISTKGSIYTWGHGRGGRLGHGDEVAQLEPTIINSLIGRVITFIASSENHILALTNNGDVYSWGSDKYGQLGHGNKSNPDYNKLVSPRRIDALKKTFVMGIAVGDSHSICFTDKGEVYSWGSNQHGQLGLKASELTTTGCGTPSSSVPKKLSFIRSSVATSRYSSDSSSNNHIGVRRYSISLNNSPILQVSASYNGNLLLCRGADVQQVNEVYQWGHGMHYPTKVHFWDRNVCRRKRSVSLSDDAKHFCSNNYNSIINISGIATGKIHNVALSQEGIVYTWGLGADQLGHGCSSGEENSHHLSQPQVVEALLPENGGGRIVSISASSNRTCAVSDVGDLFSWGSAYERGVLGPNSGSYQPIPQKIGGVKRAVGVSAGEDHTLVLVSCHLPPLPLNDTLYPKKEVVVAVNNHEEEEAFILSTDLFVKSESSAPVFPVLSLKDICQRHVADFVNNKNAIAALVFAERYDAPLLATYTLQYIELSYILLFIIDVSFYTLLLRNCRIIYYLLLILPSLPFLKEFRCSDNFE